MALLHFRTPLGLGLRLGLKMRLNANPNPNLRGEGELRKCNSADSFKVQLYSVNFQSSTTSEVNVGKLPVFLLAIFAILFQNYFN